MSASVQPSTLEKFTTFGDLLRFLRRRVSITQVELAAAVGYSNAQISRLEQNLRLPDLPTIEARFVPALGLENEPRVLARLVELAANAPREDAPALGVSPYKGLNYFDEADAHLFAGREVLTGKLAQRLTAIAAAGKSSQRRFMAIVGASGSGKSSVLRAGLLPALRRDPAWGNCRMHVITPTSQPLESLAASLTDSVAATSALTEDLERSPRSLHLFVRRATPPGSSSRVLLLVDQFEELFALCRSEQKRSAFIDNLLEAASEPDGRTLVVIALRADFYAQCAAYAPLREALADQQEYIGAMTTSELRQAIEEPARRGRWELEPGLVDLLLHDVGQEPGALPLLSHALLETWQRRRGRMLTLGGYGSSGGVRGAIAETAEAVFTDQFTPEQKKIARRIFLRLTELGDERSTGDTRRRATFEELTLKPDDTPVIQEVLKALADARLITTSENTVEVAHEALIREWPTLRGWLDEDRESLRLHRHLTEAAQEWSASNRGGDLLYRGARLSQVREWDAAHPDELNDLEREFLSASAAASEREAADEEARLVRELKVAQELAEAQQARAEEQMQAASRLKERNRLLTAVGAAAFVLALLAGVFSILFSQNARLAGKNLTRAESLRLAAEANTVILDNGDGETATLLSLRALQSAYTFQADAALTDSLSHLYVRRVFAGHAGWVYSVAFSPDGKYVLSGSQDGTARLWDAYSGAEIRQFIGHAGGVSAVAFSPDSKLVLTGGNDHTVRLWDASSGGEIRRFTGHTGGLTTVSFSPDGRYVLTASGDHTARLWNTATGDEIQVFVGHSGLVSAAAFSTDGAYILTGSFDGTARLWNASTGETIRTFVAPDQASGQFRVTSAAFSPNGERVLTGSDDGTARLWDTETGQALCTLRGHTAAVQSVDFSPDGLYMLTGSEDRTARLWLTQSCEEVRKYLGHQGGVKSVAFSPDGQRILTGSLDNTARLWAAPAAAPPRTLRAPSMGSTTLVEKPGGHIGGHVVPAPGAVLALAVSPDGKQIMTGGQEHIAWLWDFATGRSLLDFIGHNHNIRSIAFSSDGRRVLTGSDDGTAKLWDAETGRLLQTFGATRIGIITAAFSPDGKHVMTSGLGGIFDATDHAPSGGPTRPQDLMTGPTRLWDMASGREVRDFNFGPSTESDYMGSILAFSPDGSRAVAGGSDAILFDVGSGRQLCDFFGDAVYVTSVAFSPDGKSVLTGGQDHTARLWNADTCQQMRLFTDAASVVTAVAFSPEGKLILTGHDDNIARLWDVATGANLRQFQGHSAWITAVAFTPDGRYVLTGSADGSARIWDTDYHDTIRYACSLVWRDLTPEERQLYGVSATPATCPSH